MECVRHWKRNSRCQSAKQCSWVKNREQSGLVHHSRDLGVSWLRVRLSYNLKVPDEVRGRGIKRKSCSRPYVSRGGAVLAEETISFACCLNKIFREIRVYKFEQKRLRARNSIFGCLQVRIFAVICPELCVFSVQWLEFVKCVRVSINNTPHPPSAPKVFAGKNRCKPWGRRDCSRVPRFWRRRRRVYHRDKDGQRRRQRREGGESAAVRRRRRLIVRTYLRRVEHVPSGGTATAAGGGLFHLDQVLYYLIVCACVPVSPRIIWRAR